MERIHIKVGEIFTINNQSYRAAKDGDAGCQACDLSHTEHCKNYECLKWNRDDEQFVIFKKV